MLRARELVASLLGVALSFSTAASAGPPAGKRPHRSPPGTRPRENPYLEVPARADAEDGADEPWAREARELVSIVCEATDERLFHFALTPDFDAAHADHVHLEIKPQAHSFIVN